MCSRERGGLETTLALYRSDHATDTITIDANAVRVNLALAPVAMTSSTVGVFLPPLPDALPTDDALPAAELEPVAVLLDGARVGTSPAFGPSSEGEGDGLLSEDDGVGTGVPQLAGDGDGKALALPDGAGVVSWPQTPAMASARSTGCQTFMILRRRAVKARGRGWELGTRGVGVKTEDSEMSCR